jgi:hypothetical protein
MSARQETRHALGSSTAGPAGPPPPPPPPSSPPQGRHGRVLQPTPQEDYFVKATPAPRMFEPDTPAPAPTSQTGIKHMLTIIALVAGALGGLWVVRALSSDEPVLNLGADGEVSMLDAESVFVPTRGYQYRALPQGMEAQMSQMVTSLPETEGKLLGFGMRGVARGGQVVGAAVVAAVTPEVIESRGERQSAFDGLEEVGASEPEKIQLGGLDVYTVDVPTGNPLFPNAHAVIYFYENLVVMVVGLDETMAQDFTTKLIEAST